MTYALMENGIVTNIIHLHPMNAADFPTAVPLNDIPAEIGDTYDGTHFYRDGEKLLSAWDGLQAEVAALDAAVLTLTYESIVGGLSE